MQVKLGLNLKEMKLLQFKKKLGLDWDKITNTRSNRDFSHKQLKRDRILIWYVTVFFKLIFFKKIK